MAEQGQDGLLLTQELALSESSPAVGLEELNYTSDLARGPSQVATGDDVVLVTEGLAQGPSSEITLGDLTGDKALYKGDAVTLRIPATNGGATPRDYTVDFTEDGSEFASVTRTIPAGEEITFNTERTKTDTGCFTYQANDSNEHRVCWLNIDPGELLADPDTVWLGGSSLESVLSLKVDVPSSEASSITVTVDILEEGSSIYTASKTISPGNQARFSTTVSKSSEQVVDYTAEITDGASGITVETNPATVEWTNDQRATIDLVDFAVDQRIYEVGDTANFEIFAQNTYNGDYTGYTLNWLEDGTEFFDETQDVPALEKVEYTASRTKSTSGKFDFQVQDDGPVNVSEELTVAWMNVSATFDAFPRVLNPGESTQLSCTVVNDSGGDQIVTVEFYEDGTRIDAQSGNISGGSFQDFLLDVTKGQETSHEYYAVLEDESGIEAQTNIVRVDWLESGIYADWGQGLVKTNPTSVSSFSDWYSYDEAEAFHGNEIRGRGSVTLLDDGSSIAAGITYDDGNGSDQVVLEADTSFSQDVSTAVRDDQEGSQVTGADPDSYSAQSWHHGWTRENTDGGVAVFSDGFDISIGVGLPGYFFNQGVSFSGSIRFVDNR